MESSGQYLVDLLLNDAVQLEEIVGFGWNVGDFNNRNLQRAYNVRRKAAK